MCVCVLFLYLKKRKATFSLALCRICTWFHFQTAQRNEMISFGIGIRIANRQSKKMLSMKNEICLICENDRNLFGVRYAVKTKAKSKIKCTNNHRQYSQQQPQNKRVVNPCTLHLLLSKEAPPCIDTIHTYTNEYSKEQTIYKMKNEICISIESKIFSIWLSIYPNKSWMQLNSLYRLCHV